MNIHMNNTECAKCPVAAGTHKPAEAVHEIAEPQPTIESIISAMRQAHAATTQGKWSKGDTTHHTAVKHSDGKQYHVAEFRHSDDAQFCDLAHAFVPRLLTEIETQRSRIADLEAQLAAAQWAVQADKCEQDVFNDGVSIGLFDIPKHTANAICSGINAVTGARVDWHDMGGRVHFKALPASTHPAEGALVQEVQAAIDRFDAYFRSANGVPPNARVTVPTTEWKELRAMLSTHPTQQGMDAQDAIRALIAQHGKELEKNEYAYFELACTRSTGWMAWITDKPLCSPVVNPDRKVLARGQGDTPEAACADALAAQAEQGEQL